MKKIATIGLLIVSAFTVQAQDFGLSFSYFLPRHGDFSTPISPFSIRGLGFDINRFIAIETGASLYRMTGMNMKDLPFESRKPLVGPNFTLLVPVELVLQFHGPVVEFDVKGGVFGFHAFGQRMNAGNFDRALREYKQWQVANSDISFQNKPGWGTHVGAELTIYVTSTVGISLETNYLMGSSKLPLKGTYTGGNTTLETESFEYPDAKVDFTGLEFSIGVIMKSGGGGGGPGPKKRKPRR